MSLRDLLPEIPAFERRFQRKYQLRTVLRMNDLLAERGLSQKDIVERTGWSKGFVSRLLSGGGNLTLRTLARFEDAVGADVLLVSEATPLAVAPGADAPAPTAELAPAADEALADVHAHSPLTAQPTPFNGFDASMQVMAGLRSAGLLRSNRYTASSDA